MVVERISVMMFVLMLRLVAASAVSFSECRACLKKCYPELYGYPCDGSGPSPDTWRCGAPSIAASHIFANQVANCSCRWNADLERLLNSCDDHIGRDASSAARVFSPGDAGISCFRIPAIVRTTSNSLLAFAEARHGGCGDGQVHEIAMRRSTDGGRTWSSISLVVGNALDFVGNPYPIAMDSGMVALIYINHTGSKSPKVGSGNGIVFSSDDGRSWHTPIDITKDFAQAKGSSPGPGAGIQVGPQQRLLVVAHHSAYVRDYIIYSDDHGRQWRQLNHTFEHMDEGTLADLGRGEVLLNMRHLAEPTQGRAVARSLDSGLTWSKIAFDKALVGPVCQASLASFGGSVYFSNQANPQIRSHLTVQRSDDGGRTWVAKLVIQEGMSAGYSSVVQGTVGDASHGGILYESTSPGSIDFTTFPLKLDGQLLEEQVLV